MTATFRKYSTLMMAMLALVLVARPAAAQVPDTAVAEDTALMVWVDMTIVDEEMIADAAEMLGDLMDSPMLDQAGLPMGDLDLMIIQMQDSRDSFVEAGGEGILLMMSMPTEADLQSLPLSVLVKVTEDADADALHDIMASMAEGAQFEMDEYADGWMALTMDGADAVTKEGDADAAERFNAHLIERAEAPLTLIYRMDDTARDMLDQMMMGDNAEMAMLAGVMQPLRGMDTAAISVFQVEDGVEVDIAMAFDDKELGGQFLNSFNGILMLAQGMLGMQMAELDNAPSQEAITGFFAALAMQSDDGGETLRLKLDQEFFDIAEEMGPAFEEMMGGFGGGEGQLF